MALGFAGGLLHVLNHAFFKCQLFYAAGAVYQATHTVDMEKLGGLARLMPWTAISFLLGGVAISALPPLNGFTSEFVIYSGLFNGQPIAPWAKVALAAAAAGLAFVGAVSALSITRAFGVVFLGAPRDAVDRAPARGQPLDAACPRWLHAARRDGAGRGAGARTGAGAKARRGWRWPAVPGAGTEALQPLGRQPVAHRRTSRPRLALAIGAAVVAACRASAAPRRRATSTWGCGYGAPNARMQYTGSSFSWDFSQRFRGVMVLLRRQQGARRATSRQDGYLITDCVDAVERRLFSVIKHGDESATELSRRLREDDPRLAFAAALVAIVLIAGAGRAGGRAAAMSASVYSPLLAAHVAHRAGDADPDGRPGQPHQVLVGRAQGAAAAAVAAGTCCACCASGRCSARWPRRCSAPAPGWCWRPRCWPR